MKIWLDSLPPSSRWPPRSSRPRFHRTAISRHAMASELDTADAGS